MLKFKQFIQRNKYQNIKVSFKLFLEYIEVIHLGSSNYDKIKKDFLAHGFIDSNITSIWKHFFFQKFLWIMDSKGQGVVS